LSRRLHTRIDKLEARKAGEGAGDTATIIRAARLGDRRPRRTVATLEALAQLPGLPGRMAIADLRIGRIGTSTAMIDNPERELAQMMGELFDDPLGYVMWAFDWSAEHALQIVKLPEAYRLLYGCEHGPEAWAIDFMEEIAVQIKAHGFDGTRPVEAIRMAVSSGHGISKSATTAMLVNFIMSTRPNARGVITASTAVQLESKTWAEIQKWLKRSITAHWWTVTSGRGSMRMMHVDRPESWRCDAQTAREENAESFAGLHAADSTPFYIFDESSAVPDSIFEVAQGGLTDGEAMLFAFGNPTRNTGWFYSAFHGQRHRWNTRQIDSRNVSITNKAQIAEWVEDFGEQSDFVKVRVRGVFPSASSLQFIPRDLVDDAVARETPESRGEAVVIGVDPARFGDDSSVIFTRIGRDGRTQPMIRMQKVDTMTLASRVAEHVNMFRRAGRFVLLNVDGGGVGGAVVDRLRQLGYEVNEVQFGGKARDPRKHANRRAEIWDAMREWLQGGALPDDQGLAADLTSVEYGFNAADQILLERKESMKSRGIASPDAADALAITFAVPVPILEDYEVPRYDRPVEPKRDTRNYDPIAHFEQEFKALRV
jgi:hypothetical protein